MEARFEGKVAFVTGAANGLGRGMVERLRAEGAKVAAADLEENTLNEVFGDDPDVLRLACDVSDYDAVHAAVDAAVSRFGGIDILMNNAGITTKDSNATYSMLTCPKEAWDKVVAINMNGAFYVGQAVANAMVARGRGGVIVNTSSNGATLAFENIGAYCPTKAAVSKMTEVWAKELAKYNIRVNAFAPGTSLTRITEATRFDPKINEQFLAMMPFHRYGEVKEAVAVALFLASDEASFVTGETWREDGGQHL